MTTALTITDRLDKVLPEIEIAAITPLIDEIEELKVLRNAVVLAHNYMTPDIYHGVADVTGDSLALAELAADTKNRLSHRGQALTRLLAVLEQTAPVCNPV